MPPKTPSRAVLLQAVEQALSQHPVDVDKLRGIAQYGFVDNATRKREREEYQQFTVTIIKHKYYDQVAKDVERSLCHYDVTDDFSEEKRSEARASLSRIINTIFSMHPDLHYIQGYHDICSVFLLVCGEQQAYFLVERLSLLHIRDALRPSLDAVLQLINFIFPLIRLIDPEVHAFIEDTGVQSYFTLSWVLTWFSHNLRGLEDVCRIFDFLLSSHPLMHVYFAVTLILHLREGLLELPREYSAVHHYFQNLPQELPVAALVSQAQATFDQIPPAKLYAAVPELKLPPDSPVFVQNVGDLPARLTDVLTRARRMHRIRSRASRRATLPAPLSTPPGSGPGSLNPAVFPRSGTARPGSILGKDSVSVDRRASLGPGPASGSGSGSGSASGAAGRTLHWAGPRRLAHQLGQVLRRRRAAKPVMLGVLVDGRVLLALDEDEEGEDTESVVTALRAGRPLSHRRANAIALRALTAWMLILFCFASWWLLRRR